MNAINASHKWMLCSMHAWINELMNEWMKEWMNKWINESQPILKIEEWMNES